MKNNGVIFRGEEQVIRAYEMNDMGPWSLWQGNNMPFVSEEEDIVAGADLLRQALAMLKESGSESAYMLRVYKRAPENGIKNNTPWDRSFTFSIYNSADPGSPFQQRTTKVLGVIDQRFQEMQANLLERVFDKLDKEDEDEEAQKKKGPGGVMGMLNGLLEDPAMKQMITNKVSEVVGKWLGCGPSVGAIGGMAPAQQAVPVGLPEEQIRKINEAITILAAHDKLLGDHLLKLAALARDNPMKYKMGLTML